MTSAVASSPCELISEMNTTPLIDVMLVLLIMMIITIPLQTHAVKLDLSGAPPERRILLEPTKNRVTISADAGLAWNGHAVDEAQLRGLLETSAQMEPMPELHLQPDALAPYAAVDEVLAMTKRAQVSRVGFVGNEVYRTF